MKTASSARIMTEEGKARRVQKALNWIQSLPAESESRRILEDLEKSIEYNALEGRSSCFTVATIPDGSPICRALRMLGYSVVLDTDSNVTTIYWD